MSDTRRDKLKKFAEALDQGRYRGRVEPPPGPGFDWKALHWWLAAAYMASGAAFFALASRWLWLKG